MATKKKPAAKPAIKAKSVAAPATSRPAPPPQPVENKSGHLHVFEKVGMLGQGEAIELCTVCAAVRKA